MATLREARKGRRVKAPRCSLALALAAYHQPDVLGQEIDTMTGTFPVLTFVRTTPDALYSALTPFEVDPPNKATEVFAITELLENVLLQLSRKDALMCQRVSRTWRGTVVGSVKLRRHLFLAPEKDLGVVALMTSTDHSTNLMLSKYVQRTDSEAQDAKTYCQPVLPNPLLFFNTDFHNRGTLLRSPSVAYADLLAHSRLPPHKLDLLAGLFIGSRSSSACLEMFLTQPPVCEIGIELNIRKCRDECCGGENSCCFVLSDLKNPKGLRVKDVFAAARSFHYKKDDVRYGDAEEDDVSSISINFEAVRYGSHKGALLLTAEDIRLAKAEALRPRKNTEEYGGKKTEEGVGKHGAQEDK